MEAYLDDHALQLQLEEVMLFSQVMDFSHSSYSSQLHLEEKPIAIEKTGVCQHGMLNERRDVYNFGVLIMEIISGISPVYYGRPAGGG